MIRRLRRYWRAFRDGFKRGGDQVKLEDALQRLEDLGPIHAKVERLQAQSEGRPHLQVAPAFRSDAPICPDCGERADVYLVMWDQHQCPNGHQWDGPQNGGPPVSDSQRRG